MDASGYRSLVVSRGLTYKYYFSPAQEDKQTVLLVHGFPTTSHDWRHVVPLLKARGYGLIVPDLLGHGDTDKPTDPALYVSSLMSKDFVDILDAEKVQKVTVIGHDWGCKVVSRLANWYPERFLAYGFLAVPYVLPRTDSFEAMLAELRQATGSDVFGYWYFWSSDDADQVIRSHIDSFASLLYPYDPQVWQTRLAPIGALRATMLENWKAPLAPYVSPDEVELWKQTVSKNGFDAPSCWYRVMTNGMQFEDDKLVPSDRLVPPANALIFFGACARDYICLPAIGRAVMQSEAFKDHNVTIREFDSDHWVLLAKAEELCNELDGWMKATVGM